MGFKTCIKVKKEQSTLLSRSLQDVNSNRYAFYYLTSDKSSHFCTENRLDISNKLFSQTQLSKMVSNFHLEFQSYDMGCENYPLVPHTPSALLHFVRLLIFGPVFINIYLMITNSVCKNIESFNIENSMLTIHSKPERKSQKTDTVCWGDQQFTYSPHSSQLSLVQPVVLRLI